MRQALLIGLLLSVAFSGCVPTPSAPDFGVVKIDSSGIFVLCEGLWRQDNATLAFLGDAGNNIQDFVSAVNPGLRLGDTSSDIHVRGDKVFVVVNGSRTIEVFHRKSGLWAGRLRFTDNREPYKLAFVNDSIALCTFLNDNTIAELDMVSMSIRVQRAIVGPAPEGIGVIGNHVYVAISGLGDLRSAEPGAGSVVVLDRLELQPIDTIPQLPNAMSVQTDTERGIVWLSYRNLRSTPDSLGGIIALDAKTRQIMRAWRFPSPRGIALDRQSGICYVLHEEGVDELSPRIAKPLRILNHTSRAPNDIWYGLGVSPSRQTLYVCNARSYVTNGEVRVYRTDGVLINTIDVGVNPAGVGSTDY